MIKPYYQDLGAELYNMDFRENALPDESVQCVVTSPPYWGLRKYSGEQELIWGDNHCEHQWVEDIKPDDAGQGHYTGTTRWQHIAKEAQEQGIPVREVEPTAWAKGGFKSGFCSLCGAWKGAYGLEPTPEMYVQHTIEILREIRRALRKDGVVFLNMGDSYMSSPSNQQGRGVHGSKAGTRGAFENIGRQKRIPTGSIKPKDLCLIPFRIAIAAQEAGWWVRSVIIWSKPNPMPESVTDRPTESHEYILMLTKSGTTQYWTHRDGGGTREKPKADYRWVNQLTQEEVAIEPPDWKTKIKCPECNGTGYIDRDALWSISDKCPICNGKKETQLWKRINLWKGHDYYWDQDAVRREYTEPLNGWGGPEFRESSHKYIELGGHDGQQKYGATSMFREGRPVRPNPSGANIRTVWEFPTQPYPEAHFAVFPEKLPELCIKAATPEVGCCSKCGAPWERVIEQQRHYKSIGTNASVEGSLEHGKRYPDWYQVENKTLGWQPTCKCNADKVPSLVLDPFAGAGTTLWVAKKLGIKAVGFDTSEEYCKLAVERNRQQVLDFSEIKRG